MKTGSVAQNKNYGILQRKISGQIIWRSFFFRLFHTSQGIIKDLELGWGMQDDCLTLEILTYWEL